MELALIRSGWEGIVRDEIAKARQSIRLINPFIQSPIINLFVKRKIPIRLITRLNLDDFFSGVSNLSALDHLIRRKHQVRGIYGLHAKVFLFDDARAIIASTNLTPRGFKSNHEAGLLTDEPQVVADIAKYFEYLWQEAANNVTSDNLEQIRKRLAAHIRKSPTTPRSSLGDFGTRVGYPMPTQNGLSATSSFDLTQANNYFVKFSGTTDGRVPQSMMVVDSIKETHFLIGGFYPPNKRPRIVQDGDVMFLSRLVEDPDDIRIFGRAYAHAYDPERDNASKLDIAEADWKKDWPHFIRLRDIEFLSGVLGDGISLNALVSELGVNTFVATKRRSVDEPDVNPRLTYRQQAAVRLTEEAAILVNDRLENLFQTQGKLNSSDPVFLKRQ